MVGRDCRERVNPTLLDDRGSPKGGYLTRRGGTEYEHLDRISVTDAHPHERNGRTYPCYGHHPDNYTLCPGVDTGIRANAPDVDQAFLFHVVRGHQEKFESDAKGSTFGAITKSDLEQVVVPAVSLEAQEAIGRYLEWMAECHIFPPPWDEAPPLPKGLSDAEGYIRKVGEALSILTDFARLRSQTHEALSALPRSILDTVFNRFRDDGSGEWINGHTLGSVCELHLGATPARSNFAYWNGDLPWAKISDLNEGVLEETEEAITEAGAENSSVTRIPAGVLLMSFKLTIGKMAVTGKEMFTNEAIVALPIKNSNRLDRDFLRYALKATDLLGGTRDAMMGKTLNKKTLQKLAIPLPPFAEQKRVADLLAQYEEASGQLESADQKLGREADALLPALFG